MLKIFLLQADIKKARGKAAMNYRLNDYYLDSKRCGLILPRINLQNFNDYDIL